MLWLHYARYADSDYSDYSDFITSLRLYEQKDLDGYGSATQILMILVLSESASFSKTSSKNTFQFTVLANWFIWILALSLSTASPSHCSPSLLWPAPVHLPNRVSSPLKTWAILVPPSKTQQGTTQLLFMHSGPKTRSETPTSQFPECCQWPAWLILSRAFGFWFHCHCCKTSHFLCEQARRFGRWWYPYDSWSSYAESGS